MSTKSKRKTNALHLGVQELKCKNGCGFYGNPEWQGYCSKCYRELNQKSKSVSKGARGKLTRSSSSAHDTSLSPSLTFSKFEEKKKQQTEKRNKPIKSIIKGFSLKENSTHSPWREFRTFLEIFQQEREFFKTLPLDAASDIHKQMEAQLGRMYKAAEKSVDERSELMQEFYQHMLNRCETHADYHDLPPEKIEKIMDFIERSLMTELYKSVFQQISSEHEEKDLALQKRIRSLNWITAQHLETDINNNHPEVRDLIDKAITDVIEMDSKRAPQEKLNCIVNCSKHIFNILALSRGSPASADEFLPAMVYIVLKANPPLLQSNIKFITNYTIPTKLMSGEGGYYFTNLCCAVAFIENLNADSLNLSKEEFERYLSGEVLQTCEAEENAVVCEGLRLFYQNLAALNELGERQEKLIAEASSLQDDMNKFEENVSKSVSSTGALFSSTPYTIPSDIDFNIVPELFKSRVVKEPVKEEILVEIDNTNPLSLNNESIIKNNSLNLENPLATALFENHSMPSELAGISLSEGPSSLPPVVPLLNDSSTITPLSVCLPPCDVDTTLPLPCDQSQNFAASQQASESLNILRNLEYPTELIQDTSASDVFEVFEQKLDGFHQKTEVQSVILDIPVTPSSQRLQDPLSPGTENSEESFSLPPPLQPVVLQNCSDILSQNGK